MLKRLFSKKVLLSQMSYSSFIKLETFYKKVGVFFQANFWWVDFFSPSTLHLTPFVKILLEQVVTQEEFTRLELGVHEALVNAVIHGNRCDPKKSIRVRRIITPNWLILQIQDEGDGVPFKQRVSNLPSELDADSGRGLFLIHACFDDVRWSPRGNRLQLASKR